MNQPLLPVELQVVACGTLLAFFAWVIYLVRFHRLSLRDSLLWLLSTAVVLVFTLFPRLLQGVARLLAVEVPSNALFAIAIVYLTLNVLSLTISLSNNASRARRLAQECALLRAELHSLRTQIQTAGGAERAPGMQR